MWWIFTRTIDTSFEVHEELLNWCLRMIPLMARTFSIVLQVCMVALTSCQRLLRMAHPRCRGDTPVSQGSSNRAEWTELYWFLREVEQVYGENVNTILGVGDMTKIFHHGICNFISRLWYISRFIIRRVTRFGFLKKRTLQRWRNVSTDICMTHYLLTLKNTKVQKQYCLNRLLA